MSLEITEVAIHPYPDYATRADKKLANARIVINGELVINSITIMAGKFGPFISWYRVLDKSSQTGYSIAFPITAKLQDKFTARILTEWQAVK